MRKADGFTAMMKSTGSMDGGALNSSAYPAYANYFVKFIQVYKAQGIPIYAVTPQNEPLYVPNGYPGMSLVKMSPRCPLNVLAKSLSFRYSYHRRTVVRGILSYEILSMWV